MKATVFVKVLPKVVVPVGAVVALDVGAAATATVTVSESIPTALSFCKGATVASAVLDSSLKFYSQICII